MHETKLFFSGDIGRMNDMILRQPQPFPQADIIICESTYGDKEHEDMGNANQRLKNVVIETCVQRKGKLIIPAFSLGRTQELLYALDRLHTHNELPHVKTYIDSPLSVNITSIMRKHAYAFNDVIKEYMKRDPDPFSYDDVTFITEVSESKALNDSDEPCIIISASGMIEAGRVKHHVKNNIGDSRNTILIVGYCPPTSLGGKLINGDKYVRIFGKEYEVHARIEVFSNYSAHGDYNEMMKYLSCQDPSKVKQLFLVHGEPDAQKAFKTRLEHAGFTNVIMPFMGESFKLKRAFAENN
jgi:metallo-beta-lactamase family protein